MLGIEGLGIVAVTVQAFVTGAYLASFLLCLRWHIFSDDGQSLRKGINRPFLYFLSDRVHPYSARHAIN